MPTLFHGLVDAVAIWRVYGLIKSSTFIKNTLWQCVILNGLVLIGIGVLFDQGVRHLLFDHVVFGWTFDILFFYPLYFISSIISAFWYQNLFTYIMEAMKVNLPDKNRYPSVIHKCIQLAAEEIFRILIVSTMMLQMMAISYLPDHPYVKCVVISLRFLYACIIYSFYLWDYLFCIRCWNLQRKLTYIENNWIYFFAYGMPLTLIITQTSRFIGLGLYAILFPLFVMLTLTSQPQLSVISLPIFKPALLSIQISMWICRCGICLYQRCTCRKN